MEYLPLILQLIVAAGILNVWVFRFHKGSPYRGGAANSMPEEFAVYGLPKWFMWLVGTLKVGCALALIAGVWIPQVTAPAAMTLAALMVGALAMHLKVKDPLSKSLPAFAVLVLSLLIVLL
jgi:hypothetical protein